MELLLKNFLIEKMVYILCIFFFFFLRQKQEPNLNWVRVVRVAMFNNLGGLFDLFRI